MCNRFGKCSKYVERTSYMMITCLILVLFGGLGVLGAGYRGLAAAMAGGDITTDVWSQLITCAVMALIGCWLAFKVTARLK